MDLVVPLGKGSLWKDNELRYALRSFERFAPDVERVVLVGERPAWVHEVIHLEVRDNAGTHNANMLTKMRAALEMPGLSDRFIWTNDDIYLLDAPDWSQVQHLQAAPQRHSYFGECMRAAVAHLRTLGVERVHDYELHVPVVLEARTARKVMEALPHLDMAFRTVYFNLMGVHSFTGQDVKIRGNERPGAGWWCFSSHTHAPQNSGFIQWMEASFPRPSRWEK